MIVNNNKLVESEKNHIVNHEIYFDAGVHNLKRTV